MNSIELLKEQIEEVRNGLNHALDDKESMQECYDLNLQLDALIEKYINLTENNLQ